MDFNLEVLENNECLVANEFDMMKLAFWFEIYPGFQAIVSFTKENGDTLVAEDFYLTPFMSGERCSIGDKSCYIDFYRNLAVGGIEDAWSNVDEVINEEKKTTSFSDAYAMFSRRLTRILGGTKFKKSVEMGILMCER